jgi:hypothetical protein
MEARIRSHGVKGLAGINSQLEFKAVRITLIRELFPLTARTFSIAPERLGSITLCVIFLFSLSVNGLSE